MALDKKEAKTLWVQFAHDAISRYVVPEETDDVDELVDDMVAVSTKYADSMIDELEDRFEKRASGSGRRRSRSPEEPEN